MKYLKLVILILFIPFVTLGAQESSETPDYIHPKDAILKDQVKSADGTDLIKKYTDYKTGGIIIKGRAASNIEKAGTTTEITGKEIEERSNKLLKDVLCQVPGIQVATQRKGTTMFSIRGYDMSKVAILVDGIPVIDAYGSNMDIDNIGLADISEIIVSRGTSSALYGTRGVVGSVNLVKIRPSEMYTNVFAEYGEHMNFVTGVSHGASMGDFYYYLSGSYDRSNGYSVSGKLDREEREKWLLKLSRYDLYGFTLDGLYNTNRALRCYLDDTGVWDHNGHEKYKVNGKAGYQITSALEAGVSSFYNHTEKQDSSYLSDMKSIYNYDENTGGMTWQTPNTSYALRNISSNWPEYNDYALAPYINYERGNFRLKGNMYFYEQSNMFMAYADPQETVLAYHRDVYNMTWSIWTSQTYGFNIYPSYRLSSWDRLNFALTYYISNHKEEEKAYDENSTETIQYYGTGKYEMLYIEAAYLTLAVEDEMRIMKNIDLTLGISYDAQDLAQYSKKRDVKGLTDMVDQYQAGDDSMIWGTRDSFNPVAGIVYEPVMNLLKLRASSSLKTSFPTLHTYTKTVNYYQESSDPDSRDVNIKSEKSFNGNTGFEFSFFDGQLKWGADYFYSRYYDKITRIYITRSDDYIYRNIDSAVIHGAESIFKSSIQDILGIADIDILLTYTYTLARNRSDAENSFVNKGDRLEKLPVHKFTFDIRTRFKTDTSVIIFGYYENNQIVYTMDSVPATYDEFSTSYFHAQRIHDPLMIDVKLSQKIFYRYEVYVMCKNIFDDYAADPFNPGPGRQFYFGTRIEL